MNRNTRIALQLGIAALCIAGLFICKCSTEREAIAKPSAAPQVAKECPDPAPVAEPTAEAPEGVPMHLYATALAEGHGQWIWTCNDTASDMKTAIQKCKKSALKEYPTSKDISAHSTKVPAATVQAWADTIDDD